MFVVVGLNNILFVTRRVYYRNIMVLDLTVSKHSYYKSSPAVVAVDSAFRDSSSL